ncbi:MAG: cytochrome c biogenesis protein CcdA [Fuerstiella sp.]
MYRYLPTILCCGLLSATGIAQETLPFSNGGFNFRETQASKTGVDVSAQLVPVDARTLDLKVTVKLPEHHYIYSATTPFGIPTSISVTEAEGFELIGGMTADRKPKVVVDDVIEATLEKFYDQVTWTLRLQKTSGTLQPGTVIAGELKGQYCTDETCVELRPPATFQASLPDDFVAPEGLIASTTSGANAPASEATVRVVPEMRLPKNLKQSPVTFTVSLTPSNPQGGDTVVLSIQADMDRPWHTYSITQPVSEFGPRPTRIELTNVSGLQKVSSRFQASPAPETEKSELDDAPIEIHHDTVTWTREYVLTGETAAVEGIINFQICNKGSCLPMAQAPFRVATAGAASTSTSPAPTDAADDAVSFGSASATAELIPFIISAISAGFLALLTPCVFPMIPVTVSYFLKQGSNSSGSTLKLATIYCLGIVGAFTGLGLLMAVLVGPTALNQLANNPWLNLFFAAVFTVFALMLMGMFELRIPSWLLTWSSKNEQSGGVVGVLFMALTFTLVSFTCTFAFVGSLLVWAARGDYFMPIIGMVAFSSAFASPFFLLAMFPGFLKKMPKSGGWMNSVKVTLGLVELAIVTKFLSVADTGFSPTGTPQYLDYHLVMGSWIAVAAITCMYLLNVFRMPHDSPSESVGPLRCLFSIGFFGLAAYIAVGLFSARAPDGVLWQQIVAFAPPQIEFSSNEDGFFIEHDGLAYSLDFDNAVETASSENKPMFLDFTGVNCINCRRMEKGVLATEEVHSVLADLVRVQLYVDEVPGVKTKPDEHDRLLKRNHDLQEEWFGDVTIPAYVIATPDGQEILSTFKGLDTSGVEFRKFLAAGLTRWKERQSASHAAPVQSNLAELPPAESPLPATTVSKASFSSQ